jgi:uncharacterized protein YwqG
MLVSTQAELRKLLIKHGLARYWPLFKPFIRTSIHLILKTCKESEVDIGDSKIGGYPDLPESITWPTNNEGQALSFLGQINLCNFPRTKNTRILPQNGHIFFFYNTIEMPWGFTPKDRTQFKVLFFQSNTKNLRRISPPHETDSGDPLCDVFKTAVLSYEEFLSIPVDYDLIENQPHRSEYLDLTTAVDSNIFKMLGHPNTLQGPMEPQCELIARGIDCGDDSKLPEFSPEETIYLRNKWTLLLQLDSSHDIDLQWSNGGRLYFWIPTSDLKERRFDNSWAILQTS